MRPRRYILALLLLTLAAAPKDPVVRYLDAGGAFALSYPARWTPQPTRDPTLTAFAAPAEYRDDAFQETVSVRVQAYPDGKVPTPAEARAALREQMEARGATLGDSDGRATLAGRPAHRYTWAVDANGLRLTMVQLLAVDRGRLFVVTFTTQRGHEHIYRKAAEAMLAAFEIDPNPPATRPSD